jgi:hypothetical protein
MPVRMLLRGEALLETTFHKVQNARMVDEFARQTQV